MTDPDSGWPAWKQLADAIREQIASGDLAPGARLPSEESLQQEHGLSRTTVRRAILTLRAEGLVDVDPPRPTRVRGRPEVELVNVSAGKVTARMPTPAERRHLDIPEGTPVLVVERDGAAQTYPADRTALRIVPA
jgi:GntR family transcriptional regulator